MRIAVLGNAGSGKSTLAAKLSVELELPLCEIDKLLWLEGWELAPVSSFEAGHEAVLASENWIIEGLGRQESIPQRIDRATHIILCDFPIWQNFWLLSERQTQWYTGTIALPPGGQSEAPPTRALFETVWTVENEWMPSIREMIAEASASKFVQKIDSFEELQKFVFAPQ